MLIFNFQTHGLAIHRFFLKDRLIKYWMDD